MKLLVQPDDGIGPVLAELKKARFSIDTTIFRFDLGDVEKALGAAVERGVQVRALIAHTNRGGEKLLRKLELRFLEHGITLARSDDDLVRYHGKMLVVDRETLLVMLFNYTRLDTVRSRSFAITTTDKKMVAEALKLFEADMTRHPYVPSLDTLVVSPENSRKVLSELIKGARKQLLIYDPKLSDRTMVRLLQERARNGVEVRVIGKVSKGAKGLDAEKPSGLRLHARVIIRDGKEAFLGSQSLREIELEGRREVGIIIDDEEVIGKLASVFEADWTAAKASKGKNEPEPEPEDEEEEETEDELVGR